jgi:CRISPR-associated protein Cmx8
MTVAGHPPTPADLPARVHRMVRAYVFHRTEERSGVAWDSISSEEDATTGRSRKRWPSGYVDIRNRICEAAFLAMRSRRSRQDFVDYFTSTICAAPQFLPETDYYTLADTLLRDGDAWEDVKALAMLTVSSLYLRTGSDS